ncbi:MAG: hypothetical protein M1833_000101 [Piccolia ochrophora]|nr:MAG: hypothetical protein M1833_000101 [Piccolia ochrophora]
MPDTNYFVCTLGEAAVFNALNPHPFSTISDFLDHQARTIPQNPAVGFAKPVEDEQWIEQIITFQDLRRGAVAAAKELATGVLAWKEDNDEHASLSRTVGMLLSSSTEFLFLWLGLTRLGFSSLHIAACQINILFYDGVHQNLAQEAFDLAKTDAAFKDVELKISPIPNLLHASRLLDLIETTDETDLPTCPYWIAQENDIDFLHHTSGTSSGIPKSIPQTHREAVGVLPCLTNGHKIATFTTTPLFHGGISDCFRAWTSGALIWLFPAKSLPITTSNILKCLQVASDAEESNVNSGVPRTEYFSSVPFILQMMAAEGPGLDALRSMAIVGVGGAALPSTAGDDMVQKGVNLVSRFGNAESGYLLSSHRRYTSDREWQYLRATHGAEKLRFEPRENGTAELVIMHGWPRMGKRNRPDGSFATADLFSPHPTIPHAWKYHSRADAQLTLVTGKKFDPAPMEASIATSSLLDDVLVFGNGQQMPGALLFPSKHAANLLDSDLIEPVWPKFEEVNAETVSHGRISKNMLLVLQRDTHPLEKSSKGTILRSQAEERFEDEITKLYESQSPEKATGTLEHMPDEAVIDTVMNIIQDLSPGKRPIGVDDDLFARGIDSVAAMQVRSSVQKLLSPTSDNLPLNVVYDCGTIEKIANLVVKWRHGQKVDDVDELKLMWKFVEDYSDFGEGFTKKPSAVSLASKSECGFVVLTGVTGALGAHLLDIFRNQDSIRQIICLVRAKDDADARERVNLSLNLREKLLLVDSDQRVLCLAADLTKDLLGLRKETYETLSVEADLIVHAAWAVNFSMRLRNFKEHFEGLRNLIRFALHSRSQHPSTFLFCSSTASVLGIGHSAVIPEMPLTWLPVDLAAKAIQQISTSLTARPPMEEHALPVYHLVNRSRKTTWADLLAWLRGLEDHFAIVPPSTWVQMLDELQDDAARHPARKLLGLWQESYASERNTQGKATVEFAMEETIAMAPMMSNVPAVDEEQFRRMYRWMERSAMLPGS